MKQKVKTGCQSRLNDVKQAFSEWRKKRKHRTPIPPVLWDAAVNLSREYSINQISKALHVNYTAFKKAISSHPS